MDTTPAAVPPGAHPPLAERLMALGYTDLFQRADYAALDALWREPGVPAGLAALAVDPAAAVPARFLAAEILFHRAGTCPPAQDTRALADAYAAALAQGYPGGGNVWGVPGQAPDGVGAHVVSLGREAIPAFLPLLDDDTPVPYEGSEEAMEGRRFGFRVKDLAAHLLAAIAGVDLPVSEDPRARDAEIDRLRASLR
ncbi:MAG TPA: hypothetical protein VF006_28935 [Longimicrobium sp.]